MESSKCKEIIKISLEDTSTPTTPTRQLPLSCSSHLNHVIRHTVLVCSVSLLQPYLVTLFQPVQTIGSIHLEHCLHSGYHQTNLHICEVQPLSLAQFSYFFNKIGRSPKILFPFSGNLRTVLFMLFL